MCINCIILGFYCFIFVFFIRSFSGFVGDRYIPEGTVRHESYSVTPRCATPHEVRQPSLSPLHRRSPPPAYPHGEASQNIPLNLSIGNSTGENHKLSPLRQLLRPSVITCAPAGNKFCATDNSQSFSAAIRREINSGNYPLIFSIFHIWTIKH